MYTTKKLLNSFKKANGNCTNYRVALLLGVSQQTVLTWDKKGIVMGDQTAMKVAELLGLDEEMILIDLQCERMKGTPSAPLWREISKRFQRQAA